MNAWNLRDQREHLYASKTREINRSHLSLYDQLWSAFPFTRPLATITKDTLCSYGVDKYGCSVHDIIGSQCDPYSHRLLHGTMGKVTCHQNLLNATKRWGIQENNIHDVFGVFICSGFDGQTREYMVRPTPAEKGDYFEILAERDLLIALSACPLGDGVVNYDGESKVCYPIEVYVGQPEFEVLQEWKKTKMTCYI